MQLKVKSITTCGFSTNCVVSCHLFIVFPGILSHASFIHVHTRFSSFSFPSMHLLIYVALLYCKQFPRDSCVVSKPTWFTCKDCKCCIWICLLQIFVKITNKVFLTDHFDIHNLSNLMIVFNVTTWSSIYIF